MFRLHTVDTCRGSTHGCPVTYGWLFTFCGYYAAIHACGWVIPLPLRLLVHYTFSTRTYAVHVTVTPHTHTQFCGSYTVTPQFAVTFAWLPRFVPVTGYGSPGSATPHVLPVRIHCCRPRTLPDYAHLLVYAFGSRFANAVAPVHLRLDSGCLPRCGSFWITAPRWFAVLQHCGLRYYGFFRLTHTYTFAATRYATPTRLAVVPWFGSACGFTRTRLGYAAVALYYCRVCLPPALPLRFPTLPAYTALPACAFTPLLPGSPAAHTRLPSTCYGSPHAYLCYTARTTTTGVAHYAAWFTHGSAVALRPTPRGYRAVLHVCRLVAAYAVLRFGLPAVAVYAVCARGFMLPRCYRACVLYVTTVVRIWLRGSAVLPYAHCLLLRLRALDWLHCLRFTRYAVRGCGYTTLPAIPHAHTGYYVHLLHLGSRCVLVHAHARFTHAVGPFVPHLRYCSGSATVTTVILVAGWFTVPVTRLRYLAVLPCGYAVLPYAHTFGSPPFYTAALLQLPYHYLVPILYRYTALVCYALPGSRLLPAYTRSTLSRCPAGYGLYAFWLPRFTPAATTFICCGLLHTCHVGYTLPGCPGYAVRFTRTRLVITLRLPFTFYVYTRSLRLRFLRTAVTLPHLLVTFAVARWITTRGCCICTALRYHRTRVCGLLRSSSVRCSRSLVGLPVRGALLVYIACRLFVYRVLCRITPSGSTRSVTRLLPRTVYHGCYGFPLPHHTVTSLLTFTFILPATVTWLVPFVWFTRLCVSYRGLYTFTHGYTVCGWLHCYTYTRLRLRCSPRIYTGYVTTAVITRYAHYRSVRVGYYTHTPLWLPFTYRHAPFGSRTLVAFTFMHTLYFWLFILLFTLPRYRACLPVGSADTHVHIYHAHASLPLYYTCLRWLPQFTAHSAVWFTCHLCRTVGCGYLWLRVTPGYRYIYTFCVPCGCVTPVVYTRVRGWLRWFCSSGLHTLRLHTVTALLHFAYAYMYAVTTFLGCCRSVVACTRLRFPLVVLPHTTRFCCHGSRLQFPTPAYRAYRVLPLPGCLLRLPTTHTAFCGCVGYTFAYMLRLPVHARSRSVYLIRACRSFTLGWFTPLLVTTTFIPPFGSLHIPPTGWFPHGSRAPPAFTTYAVVHTYLLFTVTHLHGSYTFTRLRFATCTLPLRADTHVLYYAVTTLHIRLPRTVGWLRILPATFTVGSAAAHTPGLLRGSCRTAPATTCGCTVLHAYTLRLVAHCGLDFAVCTVLFRFGCYLTHCVPCYRSYAVRILPAHVRSAFSCLRFVAYHCRVPSSTDCLQVAVHTHVAHTPRRLRLHRLHIRCTGLPFYRTHTTLHHTCHATGSRSSHTCGCLVVTCLHYAHCTTRCYLRLPFGLRLPLLPHLCCRLPHRCCYAVAGSVGCGYAWLHVVTHHGYAVYHICPRYARLRAHTLPFCGYVPAFVAYGCGCGSRLHAVIHCLYVYRTVLVTGCYTYGSRLGSVTVRRCYRLPLGSLLRCTLRYRWFVHLRFVLRFVLRFAAPFRLHYCLLRLYTVYVYATPRVLRVCCVPVAFALVVPRAVPRTYTLLLVLTTCSSGLGSYTCGWLLLRTHRAGLPRTRITRAPALPLQFTPTGSGSTVTRCLYAVTATHSSRSPTAPAYTVRFVPCGYTGSTHCLVVWMRFVTTPALFRLVTALYTAFTRFQVTHTGLGYARVLLPFTPTPATAYCGCYPRFTHTFWFLFRVTVCSSVTVLPYLPGYAFYTLQRITVYTTTFVHAHFMVIRCSSYLYLRCHHTLPAHVYAVRSLLVVYRLVTAAFILYTVVLPWTFTALRHTVTVCHHTAVLRLYHTVTDAFPHLLRFAARSRLFTPVTTFTPHTTVAYRSLPVLPHYRIWFGSAATRITRLRRAAVTTRLRLQFSYVLVGSHFCRVCPHTPLPRHAHYAVPALPAVLPVTIPPAQFYGCTVTRMPLHTLYDFTWLHTTPLPVLTHCGCYASLPVLRS